MPSAPTKKMTRPGGSTRRDEVRQIRLLRPHHLYVLPPQIPVAASSPPHPSASASRARARQPWARSRSSAWAQGQTVESGGRSRTESRGGYDFRLPPDRTAPVTRKHNSFSTESVFYTCLARLEAKQLQEPLGGTVPNTLHTRASISPHRFIGRAYRNGHNMALAQLARPCLHKEFQMNAKRFFTNEISDVINTANLN
jgi:hypothetical protein